MARLGLVTMAEAQEMAEDIKRRRSALSTPDREPVDVSRLIEAAQHMTFKELLELADATVIAHPDEIRLELNLLGD